MLATATMARPQRISWPSAAPNITVIKFTMTAMIGKPPCQINMPRLDAYQQKAAILEDHSSAIWNPTCLYPNSPPVP
jgi:hypothetical protein